MKTRLLIVTLIVLASSVSFAADGVSEDVACLARSNTAFALDLYSRLQNEEGNLFFSPYSISTALAMTYGGARGNTAGEMERALHFAADPQSVHPALAALREEIAGITGKKDIRLDIANSLWPRTGHPFRDAYLSLVKEHYGATITPLDFVRRTEDALRTINEWVERETGERIRELIRPGDLDPATALVLVNAVYFKGEWALRFDASRTMEDRFILSGGGERIVPLMHQVGRFNYSDSPLAQVLELPYAGSNVSMFILLPREGARLSDVESALSEESLESWLSGLSETEVALWLPRFRFTWGTEDLARPLAALGMRDAFVSGKADFSGMDGTRSLFISGVLHKAFVEVDEEGSEAAAATAVVMKKGLSRPTVFRADRPFLFIIRENSTGTILFLGRLMDPSSM